MALPCAQSIDFPHPQEGFLLLDGIAWEGGWIVLSKKLYNLKNFNKTIYLKFKTWIVEAILLVYKTICSI